MTRKIQIAARITIELRDQIEEIARREAEGFADGSPPAGGRYPRPDGRI